MLSRIEAEEAPSSPTLDITDPNNQEHRDKIEAILTSQVLTQQVDEFFRVQKDFHKAMQNLVGAFSQPNIDRKEIDGVPLDKLLAPYQALIDNPFHTEHTGNIVSDLLHIINVVNKQNKAFHQELTALNKCIINKKQISNLLTFFRNDPELSDKIQQHMGFSTWMMVEGQTDKPFQLLTRYELLLNAIHKTLITSHCDNIEATLHGLMSSVEYLVPEVRKINDNLGTILELNKVEHILSAMLELDKVKNAPTTIGLVDKITFVLDCVKTAKRHILENHQDNHILYKALIELLTDITTAYKALPWAGIRSYLTRETVYKGYSALYGTLFGWPEEDESKALDPGVELDSIIEKFKTTVDQIEALRGLIEKHKMNAAKPTITLDPTPSPQ